MRQVLLAICIVIFALFTVGRGNKSKQERTNEIVSNFQYIKDPRTNLCFIHYWGGSDNQGGPALTLVPHDPIPVELLI